MSSLNEATILGNLGRDPEVRTTQAGQKIVNLSIGTSETWKDKNTGERKEQTEWHRVVIMNDQLADVAEKYLTKGSQVLIKGKIQTRKWTDKDGADKYSTEIMVGRFDGQLVLLGGKPAGSRDSGGTYGQRRDAPEAHVGQQASRQAVDMQRPAGRAPARGQRVEDMDDAIPF